MNTNGKSETKKGSIFESPYKVDVQDEKSAAAFMDAVSKAASDVAEGHIKAVYLHVETDENFTTFGIESVRILNEDYIAVGMLGIITEKVYEPSSELEDAETYLIEDIVCAVGETFTCKFSTEMEEL